MPSKQPFAVWGVLALTLSLVSCAPVADPKDPASPSVCALPEHTGIVPDQGALFGVNLDWGHEQLSDYAQRLGHSPAVAVSFTDFPFTETGRANLDGAAGQVREQGGILLLTLEVLAGPASATQSAADDLAVTLHGINSSGVPVIVRFAHEMNGTWYPWGQQPAAYIAAFRRVADAIHRTAPASATMWAPNYGGGYPFRGGPYEAAPGSEDRKLLDTNADGVLDGNDDPYAPYYPGDDAVDWVGISLYHWGNTYPWGANVIPESGKFEQQLTGIYNGAGGNDLAVPDFYAVYGEEHGKPVAIPETAALFNPSLPSNEELAIKQAWWGQVFSPDLHARFPKLKMVNWFEWNKQENEVGSRVDWTATGTPAIRTAFTNALPDWLVFGQKPNCKTG
ncbi:hypothetical protein GU243_08390 [Pseudarthrobacter psychrotolerans]|uniref:GH26 domain-containing protein n=1 Tax=Pseudarthrobacter psychrotolerans TaxID=2697569 RepID=A0A6P1NL23_9MICC|nr:glycosyl hydrolase [Pseudarthrobacter psychrotolerans]QHK19743.1 hypothetical protein GU243_08390 [Pseudarthrobacter psychrotolerans]